MTDCFLFLLVPSFLLSWNVIISGLTSHDLSYSFVSGLSLIIHKIYYNEFVWVIVCTWALKILVPMMLSMVSKSFFRRLVVLISTASFVNHVPCGLC